MPIKLRFVTPVSPTPGPVALRFGADAAPQVIAGTLAAQLPPPQIPLTLAATGASYIPTVVIAGTLEAVLPLPELPLTLVATDAQPPIEGTLAATLPAPDLPLALAAVGGRVLDGAIATALPAPALAALTLAAGGSLTLDLPDADGPGIRARQMSPRDTAAPLAAHHQQMRPARTQGLMPHAAMFACVAGLGVAQQQMIAARTSAGLPHHYAIPITAGRRLRYAETLRTRRRLRADHQHGLPITHAARLAHAEKIRHRHRLAQPHQHARPLAAGARIRNARHGAPLGRGLRIPHQQMIPLPVGWWQATYPWPEPPPSPYSSPVRLRFCRLSDGTHRLVFGCPPLVPSGPPAGVVVPILGAYLVLNTVTLVRADTGEPIPARSLACSIDADSWTWGWQAGVPAELLPRVRPDGPGEHVELIATLNGTPLRLVVERIQRDRRFGDAWLTLSGRGRAAWLAEPHSPIITRYNAESRTAQQLLADALTTNGVPIGWGLDWRLPDWLVPAGAWSHTGTYIEAATRIAEAGGGYVQAHDTDQTLILLPRYPVMPWAWAAETPDIELPEDVCEVEGIEWHDKPGYNAVWVVGGEAGRADRIRRTGTAADRYAQTVVDPLATAAEMTRARGGAILADTGRQAHISLRLPVLPETGIIKPGKLVRYTEGGRAHIGLTRAVAVDHQWPQLWQTVRLETHEPEQV